MIYYNVNQWITFDHNEHDVFLEGSELSDHEKLKNYFSIYPNPTNGIFYIETNQEGNYLIVNSIGKIIKEFDVKNENKILLNFIDFNSGIYFIINPENKQFSRQKIVIIN
jgi:hypothetical protein